MLTLFASTEKKVIKKDFKMHLYKFLLIKELFNFKEL